MCGYVGLVWYKAVTFYPASGFRLPDSGAFVGAGSDGLIWSCSISGVNILYLYFRLDVVRSVASIARGYGFAVRCVQYLLLPKKIKSLIRVEGSFIVKKAVTFYPASGVRWQTSGAFNVTGSHGYVWSSAVSGASGVLL